MRDAIYSPKDRIKRSSDVINHLTDPINCSSEQINLRPEQVNRVPDAINRLRGTTNRPTELFAEAYRTLKNEYLELNDDRKPSSQHVVQKIGADTQDQVSFSIFIFSLTWDKEVVAKSPTFSTTGTL